MSIDFDAMVRAADEVDAGPGVWTVTRDDDEITLSWDAPADDDDVVSMVGGEVWESWGGDAILRAGGIDPACHGGRSGDLAYTSPDGWEMVSSWLTVEEDDA